jgi:molecular chaperone GrpE
MEDKGKEIRDDKTKPADIDVSNGQDETRPENTGDTGEAEEAYNRMLRLQADFDNYRKRVAREKDEIYSYAAGEILLQFLSVLDNLERASEAAAGDGGSRGTDSFREGIDMVIKQIRGIMSKYHVEEIPTEGVKFDPNYHHAVMKVDDTDDEEGTILEVFQKGYRIKSRVLRPSMVKVAL